MTDPSGYSWLSKAFSATGDWLSENWRTVASIVVGALLVWSGIGASIFWGLHGLTGASIVGTHAAVVYGGIGAITGSIMGGINAAINGGDLGDIARGALVGGIEGGLSRGLHMVGGSAQMGALNIVGHGVVGGAANEAMGGKFQDGFLSAAASAATAVSGLTSPRSDIGKSLGFEGRTAVASIAGGTASALGGGKFSNGAWTGAFQHLMSAESGRSEPRNAFRSIVDALKPIGEFLSNTVGRLWSLPNTVIGFTYGMTGVPFGAKMEWDSQTGILRFTDHPFMLSAMSLGDVNLFGSDHAPGSDNGMGLQVSVAMEEWLHSIQARILGPLYLPAHIAAGTISTLTPLGSARFPFVDPWHRNNFMETGPMQGAIFRDSRFYQR